MSLTGDDQLVPRLKELSAELRGEYSDGVIRVVRQEKDYYLTMLSPFGAGFPHIPGKIEIKTLKKESIPIYRITPKSLFKKTINLIFGSHNAASAQDIINNFEITTKDNQSQSDYFKDKSIELSIVAIFKNGFTSVAADEEYISAAKTIEYLSSVPEIEACPSTEVIEKVISELAVLALEKHSL